MRRRKDREGKESRNAEVAGERERERDEGSNRATKKEATAVESKEKVTLAVEGVCACVSDRNSYWRKEGAEGARQDFYQRTNVHSDRHVQNHVFEVDLRKHCTF